VNNRLPKASTCFFNFGLPKYLSKEVMRAKILFAITFDNVSLNAEQRNMQMNDDDISDENSSRNMFGEEE